MSIFERASLPDPLRSNPQDSMSTTVSDTQNDADISPTSVSYTPVEAARYLKAQVQTSIPVKAQLIDIGKQPSPSTARGTTTCDLQRHGAVHKKANMAQTAVNSIEIITDKDSSLLRPLPASPIPEQAHVLSTSTQQEKQAKVQSRKGRFTEDLHTPVIESQAQRSSFDSGYATLSQATNDVSQAWQHKSLMSYARYWTLEGLGQPQVPQMHHNMDPIFLALMLSNKLDGLIHQARNLKTFYESQLHTKPSRTLNSLFTKLSRRGARSTTSLASSWSMDIRVKEKLIAVETLLGGLQKLDRVFDDMFSEKHNTESQIADSAEAWRDYIDQAENWLNSHQHMARSELDLCNINAKVRRHSIALSILSSWDA